MIEPQLGGGIIHTAKVPEIRQHEGQGYKWISVRFPKGALEGLLQHAGMLLSIQPYVKDKSQILNFMYAYVDPVSGPGFKHKLSPNLGWIDDKVITEASKYVTKYADDLIKGIKGQASKLDAASANVFVILDDVWDDSAMKMNMPFTDANKLRKGAADVETFLASVWRKALPDPSHDTKFKVTLTVVCQGDQVPSFLVDELGTSKCKSSKQKNIQNKMSGGSRRNRKSRRTRKKSKSQKRTRTSLKRQSKFRV